MSSATPASILPGTVAGIANRATGYAARCALGVFRTSNLDLPKFLDLANSKASRELARLATMPKCSEMLIKIGRFWLHFRPMLALLTSISGHLGPTCLYLPPTLSQLRSKLAQLGSTWLQFCPTCLNSQGPSKTVAVLNEKYIFFLCIFSRFSFKTHFDGYVGSLQRQVGLT